MNKKIIEKFLAVLISTSTLTAFAGVAQAKPPKKEKGKLPNISMSESVLDDELDDELECFNEAAILNEVAKDLKRQAEEEAKKAKEDFKNWEKELDKMDIGKLPVALRESFLAPKLDEMIIELNKDKKIEEAKKNGKYAKYNGKNGKTYAIYEDKDLIKNKNFIDELNENPFLQVPTNNKINTIYTDKSGKKYVISQQQNKNIVPKYNSNNNNKINNNWQACNQKLNANWKEYNNQIKELTTHKQMVEKKKAEMIKKYQQKYQQNKKK